jgi:hypothetical protein
MAIQLDPTQAEARQLTACLVGYWLLFAALIGSSGLFLLLMVPAAALVLFFFWIVLRIVARETGRSIAMYLNPLRAMREGQYWRIVRENFAWQWKLMSPRWIGKVARKTGWNVPVTTTVLVLSFILALLGLVRSFTTLDWG